MQPQTRLLMIGYALTFAGTAVASVALLLSVPSSFGGGGALDLASALAVRTVSMMVASLCTDRLIARLGVRGLLLTSQLVGIVATLLSYAGVMTGGKALLMAGMLASGFPGVSAGVGLTTQFRLNEADALLFRRVSSLRGVILSLTMLVATILTPVFFQTVGLLAIVLFDIATYALSILIFTVAFSGGQRSPRLASTPSDRHALGILAQQTSRPILAQAAGALLLIGLPPLITLGSSAPLLTPFLDRIPLGARASLWAIELGTGSLFGYFYARSPASFGKGKLAALGFGLSALFVGGGLLWPSAFSEVGGLFAVSAAVAFAKNRLRDDFVLTARSEAEVASAAAGYALFTSIIMALSPLLIVGSAELVGILPMIGMMFALQCLILGLRYAPTL